MYVSASKFAKIVGLSYPVILEMCNSNVMPHIQCGATGRKRVIDVEEGKKALSEIAHSPANKKRTKRYHEPHVDLMDGLAELRKQIDERAAQDAIQAASES
ncbi:MAG: hypothetical protein IJT82_03450 [Schwartzia sp.]|nr:hypothetical protein [Schwartzia sp. (in: firmicutes)]